MTSGFDRVDLGHHVTVDARVFDALAGFDARAFFDARRRGSNGDRLAHRGQPRLGGNSAAAAIPPAAKTSADTRKTVA